MAFVKSCILPRTGLSHNTTAVCAKPAKVQWVVVAPLDIQAAKHAQLKGAKKANRRRPRKHRPSDIHRKPPPYAVDPLRVEGLPEEYEIIPKSQIEELEEGATEELTESVVAEPQHTTEPIENADSKEVIASPESETLVNEPEAVVAGAVAKQEVDKNEGKQAEADGAVAEATPDITEAKPDATEVKTDIADAETPESKEVMAAARATGAAGTEP